MENADKDEKMLAILEFIHCYDHEVSMSSLVSGVSFTKLINMIPASEFNFTCKINKQAQKWSEQLQNLQNILLKIEQYFEQVHEKCLQTSNIDLISLTKHGSLEQLIKYFQIVMSLLMQSSIKESFIQSIMNLQQSSQSIFVAIIKQSLDPHNFTKTKYKSNTFYRLIAQFEQQNQALTQQIQRLCGANTELVTKCKQYQDTINEIQLDLSQKKSGGDNSLCQQNKNSKYLEEYIDKLQARIVEQGKIYQKEKMGLTQKINQQQQRISKLEQMEELGKIYKEKYDQIMDQMQKMNIWKREKAKMEKVMEEKDFIVQKLHDRIQQLTQKNLTLEEAQLQFKLDLEKKQLKIQKMSNQLKKIMDNIGNSSFSGKMGQNYLLDQSIKQCINMRTQQSSVFANEDEINLMRKQNQKLLKKIKQHEKQIIKLTKKVERLRMLEEDKNKLQQLVFQLRLTQSEELNLMFATFYQGFQQNLETSKKLRYAVLNYNEDEIIKKSKHNRKKTGSNLSGMSKGKQN